MFWRCFDTVARVRPVQLRSVASEGWHIRSTILHWKQSRRYGGGDRRNDNGGDDMERSERGRRPNADSEWAARFIRQPRLIELPAIVWDLRANIGHPHHPGFPLPKHVAGQASKGVATMAKSACFIPFPYLLAAESAPTLSQLRLNGGSGA